MCVYVCDCSWPLFPPSQEGIPDLLDPLQEQKSNLSSLISLASVLLSSPPPPPSFHPSITLSSRHSIALWNAGPLGPRGRDVDQRSDYRQVSTGELYTQTVSNMLEPLEKRCKKAVTGHIYDHAALKTGALVYLTRWSPRRPSPSP